MREAREHQSRLTKPPGSLGVLEELPVRLAGLAGTCPPPLPEPAAVAVFAADHGVHAQGVSPWPQEVTAQMVANFLAGGAVVNAFAAQVGATVTVVDVGVAADLPAAPGLLPRKIAPGTADLTLGPAMTGEQARRAMAVGIETARELAGSGARCLLTGDMGIANTTASAALIAAFTGLPPERVTGRGTGIDDATHARKIEIVRAALARHGLAGAGRPAPGQDADTPGDARHADAQNADARHAEPRNAEPRNADERHAEPQNPEARNADTRDADARRAGIEHGLRVLAAVGGFEHAALAGFILGGAALRVPVVLDGVIAGAAALAAAAIAPDAISACVAGHRSAEPGHSATVVHLGLRPLVDLELRLGEGTGALLALPLVQGAVRVLHEVATFDSAGVSGKGSGQSHGMITE
ncbi:nicotinate-nucleotide--dimethylbenzimidazole phosphoribosyltransferase [Spirillospora sp. CA-255316]